VGLDLTTALLNSKNKQKQIINRSKRNQSTEVEREGHGPAQWVLPIISDVRLRLA
jgi:hypothetical protein